MGDHILRFQHNIEALSAYLKLMASEKLRILFSVSFFFPFSIGLFMS